MFKHDGPRVLLVEGKNDCHVILSLCAKHKIEETFGLHDCGSDSLILKKMSALIAGSVETEIIGIVIDADNPNLNSKWESISNRLKKEEYTVPELPNKLGTIIKEVGKPTIGIWLMPNNDLDGMLEDFCYMLAPKEGIEIATECVENAKKNKVTTFIDNHTSKAIIHTYLAWQDEPGMPLGQAITAKSLDGSKPIAIDFSKFLTNLFT